MLLMMLILMLVVVMMVVVITEWHSGDVIPQILSDFDSSGRSVNGYIGGSCSLNTLRCYGLRDGAVVALTSRQMTLSSTTSTVYANSLSSRLPHPHTTSRPPSRLSVVSDMVSGASVLIYRWRRMRQGQFGGNFY